MEQFIIDQIKYGLKYLPVSLAKYPFTEKSNAQAKALREKEFICGVCHPSEDYKQITDANIGWVRMDIPFPFDMDWKPAEDFAQFKEKCEKFTENGIKVMAITPYPWEFFNRSLNPLSPEGKIKLRETARYIINELRHCIGGLQITNEMGIPHFTLPLQNLDEAAQYIGIQLEEIYPIKGDIIIGYNCAGPQADLHCRMFDYLKYCDYVGIDIYMGCFAPGFMWMFDALLDYLWVLTKKPIILMEFGYMSKGAPRSKEEKLATLQKYGASSEKDAKENIAKFVSNLPEFMQNHIKNVCKNDESRYFNLIFKSDYKTHIYKELPKTTSLPGYPHTYEGQAKFYRDILSRLYKKPFLAGTFVYMYHDADACHICGQTDCPTETKWGLTERDGTPKKAYYAVKEAYGKMRGKQK